jgi:hypothetical protein
MKSLYNFIVKPYNERYNNKKVGGKELIVNSNIEDHQFISKKAVVVSTPIAFDTNIKPKGDIVYIHHNIFRRWYDQKGKEKIALHILKMIYTFAHWIRYICITSKCNLNYCFVKPILKK